MTQYMTFSINAEHLALDQASSVISSRLTVLQKTIYMFWIVSYIIIILGYKEVL